MSNVLFFIFSGAVIYSALRVVTHPHPVSATLHLAACLLGIGGLFFLLGAYFLAFVQVLVYAGAVMVLFVLVVMLFDLKKDTQKLFSSFLKLKMASCLFFAGLLSGVLPLTVYFKSHTLDKVSIFKTQVLAKGIFSEYVLAFELIAVLLLVIAVGVAVICKNIKE